MPDIEKIREEHSEFRDSLEHETDSGACLIASSYLEYSLEKLVRAKLTLTESDSSFSGFLPVFPNAIPQAVCRSCSSVRAVSLPSLSGSL
jgi:hypothetical protein